MSTFFRDLTKYKNYYFFSALIYIYLFFNVELTEQEAYYWTWSKNLSWSYFDHPPLHAWLLTVSTFIFGDTVFAVRIIPFLCKAVSIIFLTKWVTKKLNSNDTLTPFLFLNSTWFFALGLFSVPDAVLFPLTILTVIKAEEKKVLLTGISWGAAILAKWHAVLIFPGILYLFWDSKSRYHSLKKIISISCIAIIIQIPVLYWNYQHDWVSFKFHLISRHQAEVNFNQKILNAITFILIQLIIAGPSLVKTIYYYFKYNILFKFKTEVVVWTMPIFIIFFISSVRGESRIYWTGIAFIFISLYTTDISNNLSKNISEKLRIIMAKTTLVNFILMFTVLSLPIGGFLKDQIENFGFKYDLRTSPRGDFYGWEEWVTEVRSLNEIDLNSPDIILITSDFHLTARIMWALKDTRTAKIKTHHNLHQYQFSQPPIEPLQNGKVYVFVEDNRYRFSANAFDTCPGKIEAFHFEPSIWSYVVKEINWYVCRT